MKEYKQSANKERKIEARQRRPSSKIRGAAVLAWKRCGAMACHGWQEPRRSRQARVSGRSKQAAPPPPFLFFQTLHRGRV
ncbi:hypothetical protein GQ54DRAFT_47214 [Martensiomyces pterosporus]|nr:hypothetical protein GQ54DRAFT_47214 [Martensiomyces pterosporus]